MGRVPLGERERDAMSRADRRHQEERVKDRFRRIVSRWFDPRCWRPPRHGPQTREETIERIAVRKAHHPKCPCRLCKGARYDRRAGPSRTREGGHA